MKTLATQIQNFFDKTDRSDWELVKFGDVVNEVKETSQNSTNTEDSRIVGLDNLTPLDIHIRTWGEVGDGKTFTRTFKKGQVLFGRRRAYQRKASLAEFDGVCSGDIIVMEANNEKMESSLLPFLVHSDRFFEWAVSTSAGSLSPRTKFKDLAEFQFRLPPMPLQKKLAEILWLADNLEEKHRLAYNKFLQVRLAYLIESYSKISDKLVPLGDMPILNINGLWRSDELDSVQVKVMRSTEFSAFGEIDLSKLEPFPVSRKKYMKSKLLPGDIIVERSGGGPEQPVGRVCYFNINSGEYSFSNFTSVIRVDDKKIITPKYLFYFLETFYERGLTDRIQKQTTGIRNLNYDLYLSTRIPLPDLNKQEKLVSQIDEIESNRHSLFEQTEKTKMLKNTILNRIFT